MKLNPDIVFDGLPEEYSASIAGSRDQRLLLGCPTFLDPGATRLAGHRTYIARSYQLAHYPEIGKGALLICAGDSPKLRHYRDRCTVITVGAHLHPTRILTDVHEIFDRFDAWQESLTTVLLADADVESLLELSTCVFENPMFVLNSNFRYAGMTEFDDGKGPTLGDDRALELEEFAQFLAAHDPALGKEGPFTINGLGSQSLNVNLIEHGTYYGCLSIIYAQRPYRQSDGKLAAYLASFLVKAMMRLSTMEGGSDTMRNALADLVEGNPIGQHIYSEMEALARDSTFACIRLRASNRFAHLPAEYVRDKIEGAFGRCWGFQRHRSSIVAFADVSEAGFDSIPEALREVAETVDAKVGVSEPLSMLAEAKAYSAEARIALDCGEASGLPGRFFLFRDFALDELIANAPGDLAYEKYFPAGFSALMAYNEQANVDYVGTLRAYLDNSMNATATARALYLHRSSFLARLKKVEEFVGDDLADPEGRVRIEMCLRIADMFGRKNGGRGWGLALAPAPPAFAKRYRVSPRSRAAPRPSSRRSHR